MKRRAAKIEPNPLEPGGGTLPSDSDTQKMPPRIGARLRSLLARFQHNPDEEEQSAEERRQRLLDHLTRTVAEAPEDRPIRDVVRQLNRHWDD